MIRKATHSPLWIILVIVSLFLSACGGAGSSTSPTVASSDGSTGAPTTAPADGAAAPTTAPADSGAAAPTTAAGAGAAGACAPEAQGQTITMWSPLTGPDGKFMTDLATQFSSESGVTVNHLPQPDYLQKLNAAAAAQKLPEMTVIRADDIAEMAARNVLKPMSETTLGVFGSDISSDFPEQVWGVGEFRDQRYAVPLDVHPLVLYYNKDLFQQAGITMPTDRPLTREEFEQAITTLNKDNVAGIALGSGFQGGTLFWTLLRQFGGTIVSEDGSQATFNSDAGVQALTYLNDLKQKYSPQISGAGDPEVKVFQQGRAAMVMHGPWHISDMQKLPFVGFAQVPQIGSQYAVWGGSHQLAMTTDDPAKQAAGACWINWLSQNSVQWAKAGQVPIRNSVRTSDMLTSEVPAVAAFAAEAEDVIMPQSVPGLVPAIWGEGFGQAVDSVLLGQQQDVKQALDTAAAKSDQILQQNRERYTQ